MTVYNGFEWGMHMKETLTSACLYGYPVNVHVYIFWGKSHDL